MKIRFRECGTAFSIFTAILTAACVGPSAVERQWETMSAEHHTTCLKRGLAADTDEHTQCVITLTEEQQRRLERRRHAIGPVPAPSPVGVEEQVPSG